MAGTSLKDKHVVVVGGSSGIGLAVAEAALAEGAKVTIASSQQAKVDAALQTLGGAANGAAFSANDEAAAAAFFEGLGGFDHLAYTAGDWGGWASKTITEVDLETASAIFKVRFWGAVTVVKHAARVIAPDGSITLTDGTVAHRPRKGAPINTAAAGAVEHLVRGLAVDLAPVRVNAVCPAMILTEVWNTLMPGVTPERLAKMTERQPLPRPGDPAEVAQAYIYCMRGGYTTGQVLKVDGGTLLV
jgi:NAD(P)-dependent dehydrogenase (short-subunit alcohol dehydrogenase family)